MLTTSDGSATQSHREMCFQCMNTVVIGSRPVRGVPPCTLRQRPLFQWAAWQTLLFLQEYNKVNTSVWAV